MRNTISSKSTPRRLFTTVLAITSLVASGEALANTVTQNTAWTITRSGATDKYRVVAYGDSIFAGYNGSISSVDRRAASFIQGEYLSNAWGTNVEVVRRTKSGAKADDIYNNKIVGDRSYMQSADTRVVSFEMCGNDFLQARTSFAGQTGACDVSAVDNALAACTKYQELAMQAVNQYATSAKKKMVMNLYYPGYDGDNAPSSCTDAATGQKINKQVMFLPRLARSNWRACNFAAKYGFVCVDAFAGVMGADYDSNGDGKVDSEALKWVAGESEDAYVARITTALRSTVRDGNTHFVDSSTSFDYILSDNTHPTYSGSTIYLGLIGGSASGSGAADYAGSQITKGKNPIWNKFGHEMMGFLHSLFNPSAP